MRRYGNEDRRPQAACTDENRRPLESSCIWVDTMHFRPDSHDQCIIQPRDSSSDVVEEQTLGNSPYVRVRCLNIGLGQLRTAPLFEESLSSSELFHRWMTAKQLWAARPHSDSETVFNLNHPIAPFHSRFSALAPYADAAASKRRYERHPKRCGGRSQEYPDSSPMYRIANRCAHWETND